MEMSADVDGRQHTESGNEDSSILGGEIAYNYFLNYKNRWYVLFRYDVGQDLQQY
jgi:hypothetical protein